VGAKVAYTLQADGLERPAEFWTARLRKENTAVPQYLRLFWSWCAAGEWKAPASPRVTFAGQPVLYKLYVVRPAGAADEPLDDDPCVAFLRHWLPEVNKALRPALTAP
jgi:hypothetical protein